MEAPKSIQGRSLASVRAGGRPYSRDFIQHERDGVSRQDTADSRHEATRRIFSEREQESGARKMPDLPNAH